MWFTFGKMKKKKREIAPKSHEPSSWHFQSCGSFLLRQPFFACFASNGGIERKGGKEGGDYWGKKKKKIPTVFFFFF